MSRDYVREIRNVVRNVDAGRGAELMEIRPDRSSEIRLVVEHRQAPPTRQEARIILEETRAVALSSEMLWRRFWVGFICGFAVAIITVGVIWHEIALELRAYH